MKQPHKVLNFMFSTNIGVYLRESRKFKHEYPRSFRVIDLVRFFFSWRRSLETDKNPICDERPWVIFSAIRFLKRHLDHDMRVYEYGVGGSTLFFAQRVKTVISVEHDRNWVHSVMAAIDRKGYKNCQVNLIEPSEAPETLKAHPADPNAYISGSDKYAGLSFEDFAKSIEMYPDEYFDIVLIDSRARPSCFRHSVKKVKESGFLILDNAEREHYSAIYEGLNNNRWVQYDLYGPGPYNYYFWQTTIWKKIR